MQRDADQTKRNPHENDNVTPRDERDIARDRDELARLIGELLARRWLRDQRRRKEGGGDTHGPT